MCDGAIIPYETVVHTLMRVLLEKKSDNYVIDGFPRATDQAHYFEQCVCEI
jgi:adenylate kinase family enzyme